MPSLKLGPHHMLGGADTEQWLREGRPAVAKFCMDFGPAQLAADLGILTVGRVIDDGKLPGGQGFDANRLAGETTPAQAAELYYRLLDPFITLNPAIQIWEGPNEQAITDPAVMGWYGEFGYQLAAKLARRGKRAGLGSWSVGMPELGLWRQWTRSLAAVDDYRAVVTLHEYGPLNTWLSLRYRRALDEWDKLGYRGMPIILSECGTDNVPGSAPWRKFFNGSAERYLAEHLVPYELALVEDPEVLGATLFTSGNGGASAWNDFDLTGSPLVARLVAWHKTRSQPMPAPTPSPAPAGPRPTHRVTATALNVRRHPWTGNVVPPIHGTVPKGTPLVVHGAYQGWGAITADSDQWVSLKYLETFNG